MIRLTHYGKPNEDGDYVNRKIKPYRIRKVDGIEIPPPRDVEAHSTKGIKAENKFRQKMNRELPPINEKLAPKSSKRSTNKLNVGIRVRAPIFRVDGEDKELDGVIQKINIDGGYVVKLEEI